MLAVYELIIALVFVDAQDESIVGTSVFRVLLTRKV